MINKQSLLFLTLTSLILVLSVYYVTMPNELLLTSNNSLPTNANSNEQMEKSEVMINNSTVIDAMKSKLDDERFKLMSEFNNKLIDKTLSAEEKNNIYEEIKTINKVETLENELEEKIKKEFGLDSFVKVIDDTIEVTINSDKHDTNLAVKIMTLIEKSCENMYVSVSFKS